MGKSIWGYTLLGSFQALRLRLLSPVAPGQARPYVSRAALWPGLSWLHGAEVRVSDLVLGLLLYFPPEPMSENMCTGGARVPRVTPPGGQEPE